MDQCRQATFIWLSMWEAGDKTIIEYSETSLIQHLYNLEYLYNLTSLCVRKSLIPFNITLITWHPYEFLYSNERYII